MLLKLARPSWPFHFELTHMEIDTYLRNAPCDAKDIGLSQSNPDCTLAAMCVGRDRKFRQLAIEARRVFDERRVADATVHG
jgi:hypothetical protein